MSEAAATELAPEPATATDDLLMQAIGELRACRAAVEADIQERGPLLELTAGWHRLAELQDKLFQVAMSRTLAEIEPAAEPEAEPARHSHRAPRPRPAGQQRALKAVREGGVVGGLVAAFKHSWAAHPVATAATGFTAATLATAAVVAPATGVVHPFGGSTSSTPNPPASVVAATPISVSGPFPSRVALALTKPKADTATSSPLNTLPPVSYPVQGPGDGQAPAPEPSSQGLAPQVRLVVSHALDLGTLSSGTIRVTAFGGETSWSASTSDGRISLDTSSGDLNPGQSAVITVTLAADLQALAESGSVTISYDGQDVSIPVTWTQIPLPQLPDPAPTDLPTDLPSVLPSIGT